MLFKLKWPVTVAIYNQSIFLLSSGKGTLIEQKVGAHRVKTKKKLLHNPGKFLKP